MDKTSFLLQRQKNIIVVSIALIFVVITACENTSRDAETFHKKCLEYSSKNTKQHGSGMTPAICDTMKRACEKDPQGKKCMGAWEYIE